MMGNCNEVSGLEATTSVQNQREDVTNNHTSWLVFAGCVTIVLGTLFVAIRRRTRKNTTESFNSDDEYESEFDQPDGDIIHEMDGQKKYHSIDVHKCPSGLCSSCTNESNDSPTWERIERKR